MATTDAKEFSNTFIIEPELKTQSKTAASNAFNSILHILSFLLA